MIVMCNVALYVVYSTLVAWFVLYFMSRVFKCMKFCIDLPFLEVVKYHHCQLRTDTRHSHEAVIIASQVAMEISENMGDELYM